MRSTGRVWGMLLLLGVLSVVATGCGGSTASDVVEQEAAGTDQPTTTTAPPLHGSAGAGSPSEKKAASSAQATTTTTATGTAATPEPKAALTEPGPKGQLEVKASLAESCVKPGGTQSITILTKPKSGTGYDTVYSDGKSGLMEGHYGGNNGGQVGEDGKWSDTWVVAPHAPAGKVQVNVLANHVDYGAAQATLFFTVADVTGKCN